MEAHKSTRELFTEAVKAILDTWPVLQIAVDNGFGGAYSQQKADWMVDVVQQYFHDNANLQEYEVEDYIADLMDNEFDTVVDDGSLPQIAQQISRIFTQCQQGKLVEVKDELAKLAQKKSAERAKVTPAPTPADEDGASEDDETEISVNGEEMTPYLTIESMECEAATSNSTSTAPKKTHQPQPPPPKSPEEEDGWTVVRKK